MILFIHGLGSCGWGGKSLALRRHFGVDRVIAPDLPFDPDEVIDKLNDLMERYPIAGLVGSSLGGFFATSLNRDKCLPCVLINPVVNPHQKLAEHAGWHQRWCDDMPFLVDSGYLETLRNLQRDRLGNTERYLVLLQTGDEVLDYREAADFYRRQTLDITAGGSHRFVGFDQYLSTIADWMAD